MKRFKMGSALLAGAGVIALSTPAVAQVAVQAADNAETARKGTVPAADPTAQSTSAAPTDAVGQEIIVTAQNRVQSVQDVPTAIAVVSGEQLRSQGVTDFTAVGRISPALQITSDTNLTKVSVRGVGTLGQGIAQDQSVAVNIDGEYLNRTGVLNAALFDIDRVEVLRGPQGTLSGRNATGGAVNFITRKPGNDFAVNAAATYGNYNLVILEGGVDVPLGSIGAIRVSGIFTDRDGYNRHDNTLSQLNAFTPAAIRRSGDDHRWGGRASLRLTPADNLTIDAVYERIETRLHPAAQAYANLNLPGNSAGSGPGCANGWVEVGPGTPGTQCIPKNTNLLSQVNRFVYDSPLTGVGIYRQHSDAYRGHITYNLGDVSINYIGGYREADADGYLALSPAYLTRIWGAPLKTQSHELRVNGVTRGVTWQGGMFYFKEKFTQNQGLYSPFIGPNGGYINFFKGTVDSRSISAFGQVEVPITEQLTAVGGIRYTDDRRTANFRTFRFAPNTGLIELTTQPATVLVPQPFTDQNVTWLAGLNYKLNADTLLYAKVSTGYKGGGFDQTGKLYQPEKNTAYEGGAKLQFGPTGQHIFNLAGFYYDYRDLQSEILADAAIGAQTFNAGKATIWGVEAEARFRLSPRDTFTATVNYLNAKYDQFQGSYAVQDPGNPSRTVLNAGDIADLSGNRIPQTPAWVIFTGYDHKFDLGSAGSVTASVFSRFKSKFYAGPNNYRDALQQAYTQTDLSFEYRPVNGAFTVQAFVRNLENTRPLTFASYVAAAQDDIFNWQFGDPRTYGVRVGFNL